jgi:phage replication O-like protein O
MARTGFRKISNDTFKALMVATVSGAAFRIVLAVIDKTLGFQKQEAPISLSHFQKVTGLSRQSVRLAVRQAENARLVTVQRQSTKPSVYVLNGCDEWVTGKQNHPSELGKEITPDRERKSPQLGKGNHPRARKPVSLGTTMPKETIKENSKETIKERYGEFKNVLLTDEERQKLTDRFGAEDAGRRIEQLSQGKEAKGYKYKSDYAAILNWERREKEGKGATNRNSRELPKTYTDSPDYDDL